MKTKPDAFTVVFLIIPLTWAGSFVAGAYAVREMTPLACVFWRYLFSALVMLPWLAIAKRDRHPRLRETGWWIHLAILVLLAGIGYHLLFFWGLAKTNPTVAALIIALNPFFTTIGEILFLKVKRRPVFYMGLAVSLAGAAWVILKRGELGTASAFGLGPLICLVAALIWSLYTLLAKPTRKPHWDVLWLNFYSYAFTPILLLPFMGEALASSFSAGALAWGGAIYMGIFPTAIGYTLFYVGVQKRGPAWASAFVYLVPPLAAVLDLLFFATPITLAVTLGIVMVIVGLYLAASSSNKRAVSDGK